MSEPIRKPSDISKAPTPQNTPSSVANLYLKQQPPTVSTINEEDDEKNLSKQLANNPAILSMIQGKLGDLVGQKSGYVESMPKSVKKRVFGLKAVQQQQMKLEAEFQKELLELEKKYLKKYEPLFEKRKAVVAGDQEPTAAEIEEGEALNEDDDEEEEEEEEEEDEEADSEIKGIPSFWLTAMENLTCVRETITERDSEVLPYLKDVRMEYLPTLGFELIFEFTENPYFSNQVLTKTYYYHSELGYSGDFVYDHADGCEINWKSKEVNVTINIERRKQRNKNTKQTRTIEKLTPTESFFNFFDPPKPPAAPTEEKDDEEEDEEDEEKAELRDRLEFDYQLGEEIKNKLIPRAIDWFTGDAVEYEFAEDFDEEEEEESFDEEDDDEDDDSDINESGPKENPPDCKQQ